MAEILQYVDKDGHPLFRFLLKPYPIERPVYDNIHYLIRRSLVQGEGPDAVFTGK